MPRDARLALVLLTALLVRAAATEIVLQPGADLAAAAAAAPEGAAFRLAAGVHRLQSIVPRRGQSFVGDPGAVLCGARRLTSFGRDGALWVAGGQTQQGQVYGEPLPGYEGAAYPEDLYVDDAPLRHVRDRAKLVPGAWYFDYDTDRVLMVDDPTGRKVEIGVTRLAFWGTAADVVISGITIEKYANQPQVGAIGGQFHGVRWTVQDCVVRLNHGLGIAMGDQWRVLRCQAVSNGQMGIGGNGADLLVEGNEIGFNNYARIDPGWEAGGTKWALTQRLIVRGNWCHDNFGPGLWTDIDNIDTLIEGNRSERNAEEGIVHEISYRATIRDNTVIDNGWKDPYRRGWLWNAGIGVHASPDVEVYGNYLRGNFNGIVAVQQARGSGAYGAHLVANLAVHDNTVVQDTVPADGYASSSGAVQDTGDLAIFTSRNNRWWHDTYYLGANLHPFVWQGSWRTETEWHDFGQDVDGRFYRTPEPPKDDGGGTGLRGEYFAGTTLAKPVLNRVDATVDFDWGLDSPAAGIAPDQFSARWSGWIVPRYSETYELRVVGDDGVRLWLDGQLVLDQWRDQAASEYVARLPLVAGRRHAIRLEYYENAGYAVARLLWSSASQARETVPATRLYPADPPQSLVSGASYRLVSVRSGECLDVAGASLANGANVWQWHDTGGDNQVWRIDDNGDGSWRLTSRRSGQVLDVAGGSTADGGDVIQWPWHGGANQRWRIDALGDGSFRLTCVASGRVLDVAGGGLTDGTDVIQWTWHGADNQRWRLEPVAIGIADAGDAPEIVVARR